MTPERFKQIINAYGTRPRQWPLDERDAAQAFARDSHQAQAWLAEHAALDDWLDQGLDQDTILPDAAIKARLLAALPPQPQVRQPLPDRLIEWLLPGNLTAAALWRPALLAAMPLLAGIVFSGNLTTAINYDGRDDTTWDDEVYLLSLTPYVTSIDNVTTHPAEATP